IAMFFFPIESGMVKKMCFPLDSSPIGEKNPATGRIWGGKDRSNMMILSDRCNVNFYRLLKINKLI
ncbi:MAG TPA: hypothetical protein PLR98_08245, partial [Chitinophagaceae bacterium]|nr:hypothetical protein [Chitinophagaceae bacterium]